MSDASDLYQQVILDHNKKPRNFGKLGQPSHQAEGFNPLCGDHIWVYVQVGGDGHIDDVKFEGSGCAICKASASMMTLAIKGKTEAEALALFTDFQSLLRGDASSERLGKLKIFSGIWQYPARVKCAALAWHALNGALTDKQSVSTE